MREIPDQLKSRNLVPFKKRHGKYKIPGLAGEHEVLMDRVDPDLSPEEQVFIRHYLGYADAFLRSVEHIAPEPPEETFSRNEKESAAEPRKQENDGPAIKAA
jgi:hypothetical protein